MEISQVTCCTSHPPGPALQRTELMTIWSHGGQDHSSQAFLMVAEDCCALIQRHLSGNSGRPFRNRSQISNFYPARSLFRLLSRLAVTLAVALVYLSAPPRKPCSSAGLANFSLSLTPLRASCFLLGSFFLLPVLSEKRVSLTLGWSRLQGLSDVKPQRFRIWRRATARSRPVAWQPKNQEGRGRWGGWAIGGGVHRAPRSCYSTRRPTLHQQSESWRYLQGRQVKPLLQHSSQQCLCWVEIQTAGNTAVIDNSLCSYCLLYSTSMSSLPKSFRWPVGPPVPRSSGPTLPLCLKGRSPTAPGIQEPSEEGTEFQPLWGKHLSSLDPRHLCSRIRPWNRSQTVLPALESKHS